MQFDVLVAGGGAAGVLSACALADRGFSVLLVEACSYGAGQSNHSHGYMHRGHIYSAPSKELVGELGAGSTRWRNLLDGAGIEPDVPDAVVAFTNTHNANRSEARWAAANLQVNRCAVPSFFSAAIQRAYKTDEPAYNFTRWFETIAANLPDNVKTLKGRVTALKAEKDRIREATIATEQGEEKVTAKTFVLTAGVGNLEIVERLIRLRGNSMNRMSYMAIFEASLPSTSVIVPDHEAYGLFMVSRPSTEGRSYWLASNYISNGFDSREVRAVQYWMRGTFRSLLELVPNLRDVEFNWGVYGAPKGELRADRRSLKEHTVENYEFRNLLVAAPNKLTLAPLLADKVSKEVCRFTRPTGEVSGWSPGRPLAVAPEKWETVPLVSSSELLEFIANPRIGDELFDAFPLS